MHTAQIVSGTLRDDPAIHYDHRGIPTAYVDIEPDAGTTGSVEVSVTGALAENVALSLMAGHHVVAVYELAGSPHASDIAVSLRAVTVEVSRTSGSRLPA